MGLEVMQKAPLETAENIRYWLSASHPLTSRLTATLRIKSLRSFIITPAIFLIFLIF